MSNELNRLAEKVRLALVDSPIIEDAGLGASRVMLDEGNGVFLNALGAFYQVCDQVNRGKVRETFSDNL